MSRRLLNTLCMLLLLIAQQGALSHATWHAQGGRSTQPTLNQDASHPLPAGPVDAGTLCDFDRAFGQMLGGVHGAGLQPLAITSPAASAAQRLVPRHSAEAIPAHSRGPPVLS